MYLIPPSFKLVGKKVGVVQLAYLKADAVHDKPFRLSFLQKEFDRQASFTFTRSCCERSRRHSFSFADL